MIGVGDGVDLEMAGVGGVDLRMAGIVGVFARMVGVGGGLPHDSQTQSL